MSASSDAQRDIAQRDTSVHPRVLEVARAFHGQFKAACHGISRRVELRRLYVSTFPSFQSPREGLNRPWNNYERFDDEMGTPQFFNRVLYALAHALNVVRVVDGGQKLLWAANRPSRRPAPRRDVRRTPYEKRIDEEGAILQNLEEHPGEDESEDDGYGGCDSDNDLEKAYDY